MHHFSLGHTQVYVTFLWQYLPDFWTIFLPPCHSYAEELSILYEDVILGHVVSTKWYLKIFKTNSWAWNVIHACIHSRSEAPLGFSMVSKYWTRCWGHSNKQIGKVSTKAKLTILCLSFNPYPVGWETLLALGWRLLVPQDALESLSPALCSHHPPPSTPFVIIFRGLPLTLKPPHLYGIKNAWERHHPVGHPMTNSSFALKCDKFCSVIYTTELPIDQAESVAWNPTLTWLLWIPPPCGHFLYKSLAPECLAQELLLGGLNLQPPVCLLLRCSIYHTILLSVSQVI